MCMKCYHNIVAKLNKENEKKCSIDLRKCFSCNANYINNISQTNS